VTTPQEPSPVLSDAFDAQLPPCLCLNSSKLSFSARSRRQVPRPKAIPQLVYTKPPPTKDRLDASTFFSLVRPTMYELEKELAIRCMRRVGQEIKHGVVFSPPARLSTPLYPPRPPSPGFDWRQGAHLLLLGPGVDSSKSIWNDFHRTTVRRSGLLIAPTLPVGPTGPLPPPRGAANATGANLLHQEIMHSLHGIVS